MGMLFGIVSVLALGGVGVLTYQRQHVQSLEQQARQAEAAARVAEAAVEKMELEVIMRALDQARFAMQMMTFIVVLLFLAMISLIVLWIYTQHKTRPQSQQIQVEQALKLLLMQSLTRREAHIGVHHGLERCNKTPQEIVVREDDPFWTI
jgi:hypothetical protein